MIKLLWDFRFVFMVLFLTGCAAGSVVQTPAADEPAVELVELECRLAYKHGCRYQGRVFPWNAWVDVMGYDAKDYEIKEIRHDAPEATVFLIKRQ